ncbi:hypothetical protein TNCV_2916671 [Trichonephila clavipes]|nr:hypothetical protein TNCV_2916671 [Trichonephila clavipes]
MKRLKNTTIAAIHGMYNTDITSRLYSKGFDIVFCWLPSHAGNHRQRASGQHGKDDALPLAVPLSDMKRVIMHQRLKICRNHGVSSWITKLHSVKPVIGAWFACQCKELMSPNCLRIGHTRFTHRHLLSLENVLLNVLHASVLTLAYHILMIVLAFNTHRMTFFIKSVLTYLTGGGISPTKIFSFASYQKNWIFIFNLTLKFLTLTLFFYICACWHAHI